jgi:hypothetical protein
MIGFVKMIQSRKHNIFRCLDPLLHSGLEPATPWPKDLSFGTRVEVLLLRLSANGRPEVRVIWPEKRIALFRLRPMIGKLLTVWPLISQRFVKWLLTGDRQVWNFNLSSAKLSVIKKNLINLQVSIILIKSLNSTLIQSSNKLT